MPTSVLDLERSSMYCCLALAVPSRPVKIIVLQSSCLWDLGRVEKSQTCKIRRSYYFGAGWKAVIARSLTFEQRQIEDCSFQQSWPFSCALQLCCWDVDLKSNSFGSRPSIMKK